MRLNIGKVNFLVVIALLAMAIFYNNIIINHQMYLPTDIDERPELLYGMNGNGLDNPMGIAGGLGESVFVSDPASHQVKIFKTNGESAGAFGKPGAGPGQLNYPYGMAINKDGKLLIADPANRRVSVYTKTGRFIKELIPPNNHLGLVRPGALTVDKDLIYISDVWGHQILVVDNEGKLVRKIGSEGSEDGKLRYPQSVVVDAQHRLWVADNGNDRIQVFDRFGKFLFSIKGEKNQLNLGLVRGMAIDSLQRVLLADAVSSKILVFDRNGKRLFSFGGLGSNENQLKYPMNLWIAKDGRIYIADRGNHRVQVWGYKGR